jgi:hypothetical protein
MTVRVLVEWPSVLGISVSRLAKRPRLTWAWTDQSQKFSGSMKTATVVWSLVHQHFEVFERPVLTVFSASKARIIS